MPGILSGVAEPVLDVMDDNTDFRSAFGTARRRGLKTFDWRGKRYTTDVAKKGPPSADKTFNASGPEVMVPASRPPIMHGQFPQAAMEPYEGGMTLPMEPYEPVGTPAATPRVSARVTQASYDEPGLSYAQNGQLRIPVNGGNPTIGHGGVTLPMEPYEPVGTPNDLLPRTPEGMLRIAVNGGRQEMGNVPPVGALRMEPGMPAPTAEFGLTQGGELPPAPVYPAVTPQTTPETASLDPAKIQAAGQKAYEESLAKSPANYAAQNKNGVLAQPEAKEEKSDAAMLGLLAAGLGILANNTGHYGAAGPAIGRGGLIGVDTFLGVRQMEADARHKKMEEDQRAQQLAQQWAMQNANIQRIDEQGKRDERRVGLEEEKYRTSQSQLEERKQLLQRLSPENEEEAIFARVSPDEYIKFKLSMKKPTEVGAGSRLVTPEGKELVGAEPAPPSGMRKRPDGTYEWIPGYIEGKRDIAAAGASKNMFEVNTQLPASEEAQKEFMKETRTTFSALKSAPVTLNNINRAKQLVSQSGGFVGSFGDKKLEVAKFFNNNFGTSIDPGGVASAEELRTRLFTQIMDNLKKMDSQPSQEQQRVMMESLGEVTTDPAALPRILDVMGEIVREKVDLYNKDVQSAQERGVKFPYNPIIDLPQSAPAQAAPAQKQIKRTGKYQGKKVIEYTDGTVEYAE